MTQSWLIVVGHPRPAHVGGKQRQHRGRMVTIGVGMSSLPLPAERHVHFPASMHDVSPARRRDCSTTGPRQQDEARRVLRC